MALSALVNLWGHARQHHVKWRCALVFRRGGDDRCSAGIDARKQFDGQKLLVLFGVLMVVIAAAMFFKKAVSGDEAVRLDWSSASELAPMLLLYGVGCRGPSGFFGIAADFSSVPD